MIRIQCPPILTLEDLKKALQGAVELEHSTIPPYLTSLYSLKMQAIRLMETPADPSQPDKGSAGPGFEYQPLNL